MLLAFPQESICHIQECTYMRSNLFHTLKELLISNFPCWHLSCKGRGTVCLFLCVKVIAAVFFLQFLFFFNFNLFVDFIHLCEEQSVTAYNCHSTIPISTTSNVKTNKKTLFNPERKLSFGLRKKILLLKRWKEQKYGQTSTDMGNINQTRDYLSIYWSLIENKNVETGWSPEFCFTNFFCTLSYSTVIGHCYCSNIQKGLLKLDSMN